MDPPGLDLTRLAAYLEDQGLTRGPLTAELITGGKSNLTYVVTDGTPPLDLVRRPPLGHVLATAHDMGREYRVMTALADTPVPVPAHVPPLHGPRRARRAVLRDGARRRAPTAPPSSPRARRRAHPAIVARADRLLADLHAVDPAASGLADFGRPEGFLERQVRRWSKQLDASRSRDMPGIDELHHRLSPRRPAESGAPAIVHGDFRLDNLLIAGDDRSRRRPRLGDVHARRPAHRPGLLLLYGDEATRPATPSDDGRRAGLPPRRARRALRRARTGRDVSRLGWYLGFACFKLAVILEGIHFRYIQGSDRRRGLRPRSATRVAPLVAPASTSSRRS